MLSLETIKELKDSKLDCMLNTSGYGADMAVKMIEAVPDYCLLCTLADAAKTWASDGNVDAAIAWAKAWENDCAVDTTFLGELENFPEPLRRHLIDGFYKAVTEILNEVEAVDL